jgi:hypothetical protein
MMFLPPENLDYDTDGILFGMMENESIKKNACDDYDVTRHSWHGVSGHSIAISPQPARPVVVLGCRAYYNHWVWRIVW